MKYAVRREKYSDNVELRPFNFWEHIKFGFLALSLRVKGPTLKLRRVREQIITEGWRNWNSE